MCRTCLLFPPGGRGYWESTWTDLHSIRFLEASLEEHADKALPCQPSDSRSWHQDNLRCDPPSQQKVVWCLWNENKSVALSSLSGSSSRNKPTRQRDINPHRCLALKPPAILGTHTHEYLPYFLKIKMCWGRGMEREKHFLCRTSEKNKHTHTHVCIKKLAHCMTYYCRFCRSLTFWLGTRLPVMARSLHLWRLITTTCRQSYTPFFFFSLLLLSSFLDLHELFASVAEKSFRLVFHFSTHPHTTLQLHHHQSTYLVVH